MKEVYDASHPRADVATVGVTPGGTIPHPSAGQVATATATATATAPGGASRPFYPAKAG
jgi:hypothetical protein